MAILISEPSGMAAIDAWFGHAVQGNDEAMEIPALLRKEIPPLISWIVRGGCAVQCQHCIFPFEGPKAHTAQTDGTWIHALLRQMPNGAQLVHEGRQLLPWQVPVLRSVAEAGYGVSLINNGQYAANRAMLALIEGEQLRIDALDVSVDGTEALHNAQRSSHMAWEWAMKGIGNARRLLKPTGMLTSLYTLTSLNCSAVRETGFMLEPLIDEWHLTTMSLRPGLEHMRASKRELAIALEQLLGASWSNSVKLRTYSLEDFVWLLEILGEETAGKALAEAEACDNAIVLDIGLPLYFYPKSLAPNETVVVDADGWWRLAYCLHYTLDELQVGRDKQGRDITHYSIAPVSQELDLNSRYAEAADSWWNAQGRDCLNAERAAVQRFLSGKGSR